MSFFARAFPWLFDDISDPATWQERIATATPDEKRDLAVSRQTPTKALTVLARDPQADIRAVLTKRLADILPTLSASEQVELYDMTVEAIRSLAEDQVTAVRVALASALKDVAKTPHDVARKLADDAERAVAEPILRYSLSLSDTDLLELIARHPTDWHPVTIAQRKRLTTHVTDAIAHVDNTEAHKELLRNDRAPLSSNTKQSFGRNPVYRAELKSRESIARRIRQDWYHLTDPILFSFLRDKMALDQVMAADVLDKVHQHLDHQDALKTKPPEQWEIDNIVDALKMGENTLVIEALAARGKIPSSVVKRMLEAENGRAVIALCVKADMPMSFATLAQSKLARLAPAKMLYPKYGDQCPLTADELRWQWEFFGID